MQSEFYDREIRRLTLNQQTVVGANPAAFDFNTWYALPAEGWSTEQGSATVRNEVQTFRVNMSEVVGPRWRREYRYFGLRLENLVWNYHKAYGASGKLDMKFLQLSISGLQFVQPYDVSSKNYQSSQRLGALPISMTSDTAYVYNWIPGDSVQLVYFELPDGQDWFDIQLTYSKTAGAPIVDTDWNETDVGTTRSYTLPLCVYSFYVYPVVPRKRLIRMNGFPLPKSKVRKLEAQDDDDSSTD